MAGSVLDKAPTDAAAATTDGTDRGFLMAIAQGFVVGTIVWAAAVFAAFLFLADASVGDAAVWAAWIGPWGGIFVGGTVSVGLWGGKHFH